ncbi:MAG: hypothetical protein J07HR59_00607 [Halorubrum sp. J07HR59]|nr:MAG: hypothetical protein J07HR59_00607 [Halorubrum sp. J07HR59]
MVDVVSEGFSLGGGGSASDDGGQCSNCGNRVLARANYCQRCGSAVSGLTRPAYCSNCGDSYSEDDEYCASCGKNRPPAEPTTDQQVDPSESSRRDESANRIQTSTDPSVDPQRQEAFRRRVREYVNDGWELTEDYGDRVVVTDRSIGSLPAHAALLIFTGGLGNLAYGWYSYAAGAETRRLAAVDTQSKEKSRSEKIDAEMDAEMDKLTAGFVSSTTMFVGLALMLAGTPSAIALGLTLVTVSVGLIPPIQDRLHQRRSLTDFGRHRRVEQRLSGEIEDDSQTCIVCGEACNEGIQRRRRDETLVFGVPVRIHNSQVNSYCEDCAETEPIGEIDSLDATGWHVASTSTTPSRSIPTSIRVWYSNLTGSEDSPSVSPPQSTPTQESEPESELRLRLESGSESDAEQPVEHHSGSSHQSTVNTGSPSSQKSSRVSDVNQDGDGRESDPNRERSS